MLVTDPFQRFARRLREFIARSTGQSPPPEAESPGPEFEELAGSLFALQYEHNAAYRKLCVARGVAPGTLEHWSQIPAAPTAAFKELELTSIPPHARSTVFFSSGTTGQQPSRHFHSPDSLALYEASLWPWFARHLFPETAGPLRPSLLMLAPSPAEARHSSLVHMFETIRARSHALEAVYLARVDSAGKWNLDTRAAVLRLQREAAAQKPVTLLGTAFMFVHLLDRLEQQHERLALPPGSRIMETGGYKGQSRTVPRAELHHGLSERLGVLPGHIISEYGMSELSSQAYDATAGAPSQRRAFHFPPWARAVVVSPESGREVAEGETGLCRVFDLANTWSVLALQTEDLCIRRESRFELLGRAALAEPRGCSLLAV